MGAPEDFLAVLLPESTALLGNLPLALLAAALLDVCLHAFAALIQGALRRHPVNGF